MFKLRINMRERFHIVHVGQTGQYERTDPDYNDKRIAKLAKDYTDCPKEWRETFLAGLSTSDIKSILEHKTNHETPQHNDG
jgi:hypothetical protein